MAIITKIDNVLCPDCGFAFGNIIGKTVERGDINFTFVRSAEQDEKNRVVFICPYDGIEISIPVDGEL